MKKGVAIQKNRVRFKSVQVKEFRKPHLVESVESKSKIATH